MSDVTRILSQIEQGDPQAAEKLLPLVYDELRKLAAVKLAQEKPGQTLQATALVHEAWLRLVGGGQRVENRESGVGWQEAAVGRQESGKWDSRGHFFAAAAEAMRRILVEAARRKQSQKQGGRLMRCDVDLNAVALGDTQQPLVVLSVHEALDRLAEKSPRKAELVKLRYFLGCSMAEAAEILGIAAATAEEDWTYARTWLRREWLRGQTEPQA
jgi:RNA polymerase sigma factor (sigma-70 family)